MYDFEFMILELFFKKLSTETANCQLYKI